MTINVTIMFSFSITIIMSLASSMFFLPQHQVGSTGTVIGVEAQRNLAGFFNFYTLLFQTFTRVPAMAAHAATINELHNVKILHAAIDSSPTTCLM